MNANSKKKKKNHIGFTINSDYYDKFQMVKTLLGDNKVTIFESMIDRYYYELINRRA
jgi:hypothetical protein